MRSIPGRAASSFDHLELRTNDAPAAAFYGRCGFDPIDALIDTTHAMGLSERSKPEALQRSQRLRYGIG